MCGQMAVHNQFYMVIFESVLTLYHCVQQFALLFNRHGYSVHW